MLFLAVVFTACNNEASTENATEEAVATEQTVEVLTVDNLLTDIDKLVGEQVTIVGTVDHVCKHGGGKLVIYTDSPENGLHVKATDESGKFRADEIGDEFIQVTGVVSEFRVDEAYILDKEAELAEMIANDDGKDTEAKEEEEHHGGGDFPDNDSKHKQEIEGLQNQIASLKGQLEELKAEGKDHISYYSVKCSTYNVMEQEDKEVKEEVIEVEVEESHDGEAHEEEGENHDH